MTKTRNIATFALLVSITELALADKSMSEPDSWSFPEVIEHARNISPTNIEGKPFNRFGLVYSSEEVASLRLSSLSAEELQKYADIVTHAYPDAVSRQLPEKCDTLPVEKMNETAVAGVAYVSINATKPSTRMWAKECLAAIQNNFGEAGR